MASSASSRIGTQTIVCLWCTVLPNCCVDNDCIFRYTDMLVRLAKVDVQSDNFKLSFTEWTLCEIRSRNTECTALVCILFRRPSFRITYNYKVFTPISRRVLEKMVTEEAHVPCVSCAYDYNCRKLTVMQTTQPRYDVREWLRAYVPDSAGHGTEATVDGERLTCKNMPCFRYGMLRETVEQIP